ncbi:MAG TPA: lysylphosphatidylglycerol synthase domain-containing protein [Beijerinckiaceae bacterium]|jgi:uncharacterized membrane protein YbhN (UPF0104 family)
MDARTPKLDGPDEDAPPQEPERASRRSRRFAWIGTAASIILFSLSLVVLWHIVREVEYAELRNAFVGATLQQIGLATLFTAVSYLCLTCYDALALRQLKVKVRYRTTALASFTSYAVSFTLGFPLLTAGTVRYWVYAREKLSTGKVASLTVIAGLTFWLGMGLVLGVSLLTQAESLARLTYSNLNFVRLLGLGAAGVVLVYLVWVSQKRRAVTIQGWRLELPGFRLTLAQMLIGAADVCAGAAVLYVLLPAGHPIPYETFLAIYVFAAMLGVASHSPGGLGVFEATILLALSILPREPVLGALLLYRIIYYLVPFVFALALLAGSELANRISKARAEMRAEEEA